MVRLGHVARNHPRAAIAITLLAAVALVSVVSSIISHHAATALLSGIQKHAQNRLPRVQILASPLSKFSGDCGEGGSAKLCELGVNVGDTSLAKNGDAQLPSDGLEDPYNAFTISPERETAGNTIGGDWFGHLSDAPVTKADVQATRAVPVRLSVKHGQMLAAPLSKVGSDCTGKLCKLGVNVGDESITRPLDAQLPAEGLEDSYNAFTISPERETAGNTIGGDWFGHLSDAPVTKADVQATRALRTVQLAQAQAQALLRHYN